MYSCTVGPVVAHAVVHFPGSVVDVLGPTRYTNHDINLVVSMHSRVSNLRFSTGAYASVYEYIRMAVHSHQMFMFLFVCTGGPVFYILGHLSVGLSASVLYILGQCTINVYN